MKKTFKKVLSSLLPLVLALVFVTGTFEVCDMLGAPSVASYVLGSSATPATPTPTPAPAKKKKKKAKKENTITVSGKTVDVSVAKVAKKKVTVKKKAAITVSSAKGKVTFKKKSGNKKITVSKSGNFTLKKGLKAGTYIVKVKVTAAGNSSYKKKTVTGTVTIRVVKPANPMLVTSTDVTISGAELANDAKVVPISSAVTVKDAQGDVAFVKSAGDEGITIEGDNIIISKGLAPGTYSLEIEVTAAGNAKYEAGTNYAQIAVFVN